MVSLAVILYSVVADGQGHNLTCNGVLGGCRVGSGIVVVLLAIIGRWLDCMPSSKPALQRIVCGPSRKSDKSKWLFLIQVEISFFLLAECII
jgi:hypothetical protein